MHRLNSQSSHKTRKQQHVQFSIPITKYINRATGKKAPSSSKGQAKVQLFKDKLLIKQHLSHGQWTLFETLSFETIDKVEDIEKTDEKYSLIKIELNTVPEKEKVDKAITFRVLDIARGKQMTLFIRKSLQDIFKFPNYLTIEEKQQNTMKYIIEMEPDYNEVYRKAIEKNLFPTDTKSSVIEFQRTILSDHPEMQRFNLLKHTLKYEQQKNILLQKLNNNAEEAQKQQLKIKEQKVRAIHQNTPIDNSNINMHEIKQDLETIHKQGKQGLQGYSSKRQFEGTNVLGGEEELYHKDKPVPYDLQERNQTLILKNISHVPKDNNDHLIDENYHDFAIHHSGMKHSHSIEKRQNQKMEIENGVNEKMEIQEGEIDDENRPYTSGSVKFCQKMKIPQSKDIRLEQKKDQLRYQKKSDIKFIDPSYSYEKQLSITKQTVIWCRLFYHYLKEGGVQKRQHELTTIQNELKRLKHIQKDAKMNDITAKMVDKVSANFLRMKRGQDVY